MFLLRGIPRLAAVILGLGAILVTAGPASAVTGSVQAGPTATLVAHGVALDVPVTFTLTCDEGFEFGVVSLFVTQARGVSVVSGSSEETFTCTGETQTITVRVFGGVFHGGTAVANARLLQCRVEEGFLTCSQTDISSSDVIMIRGR
jgi:hypothetical protein